MKARSLPVPIPLLLAIGIAAISFSGIFVRLSEAAAKPQQAALAGTPNG